MTTSAANVVEAPPISSLRDTSTSTPAAQSPAAVAGTALQEKWSWRNIFGELTSFLTSTAVHLVAVIVASLIATQSREPVLFNVVASPTIWEDPLVEEIALAPLPPEAAEMATDASLFAPQVSNLEALAVDAESVSDVDSFENAEVEASGFNRDVAPTADLLTAVGGGRGRAGSGSSPELAANLAQFSQRLKRAGAKSGDVQISLLWNNINDIDLHVITPRGEHIYFGHRRSVCSGELDVDMNADQFSREPVENIYWPKGKAPLGKYLVLVHHFANQGDPDPTAFEVLVSVDGVQKTFRGVLRSGDAIVRVYEFERTKDAVISPNDDDFPL